MGGSGVDLPLLLARGGVGATGSERPESDVGGSPGGARASEHGQSLMRIAYLLNTYPLTSTTFIRREIEALERSGVRVHRFAMRRWREALVDARDAAEVPRTTYLLDGKAGLLALAVAEVVANPAGMLRALSTLRRLVDPGPGGVLRAAAYLLEAIRFKRQAARLGIGHAHAHFASNAATVALLARRLGGPPFSFTAHGPEDFEGATRNGLRVKIEAAAFVVAISDYAWGQLAVHTAPVHWRKLHVVGCGLDLTEFPASAIPAHESWEVVCVGRLTPRKGQVLLPAAAAGVLAREPRLTLTLIGDGETRDEILGEIRRLGLGERIRLLGWRGGDEVRDAIAGCRALVLPSFSEGLPVVILEALAMGRPVIATHVAGIPEILDDTCGWLVKAGDLTSMSSALAAVVQADAGELRRKGLAGRRRVAARHDIARTAASLRALLSDCVEARGASNR